MDFQSLLVWLQTQKTLATDEAISSKLYDDRTLYFAKANAFEEVINKIIGYNQPVDGQKQ